MAASEICSDVRGRQSGAAVRGLTDDRPKPLPRQKRLQDDDDIRPPVPASRTSPNVLPTRRTPTTPDDRRNLPADDGNRFADRHDIDDDDRQHQYGESRRSPLDRRDFADRKSPHSDMFRKSPLGRREYGEGKESFERYGTGHKSPFERLSSTDRKSPVADRRPSSSSSRKSPFENDTFTKLSRQKSPVDDRKSPTNDRRKTPVAVQRKKENSLSEQRKGSVLDFLTESAGAKESESSEEERKYRGRRKSGSPQSRGQKSRSPSVKRSGSTEMNPFDDVCGSPKATSEASKQSRRADSLGAESGRRHSQVVSAAAVFFSARS